MVPFFNDADEVNQGLEGAKLVSRIALACSVHHPRPSDLLNQPTRFFLLLHFILVYGTVFAPLLYPEELWDHPP